MTATTLDTWIPTRALSVDERVLLEASAGTGKTYQTEGLVLRLVAEHGVAIDRILLITFTNAATADLRKRVRERLEAARQALGGAQAHASDVVIAHLRAGSAATVADRLKRVEAALADYDSAPISTIHGFCQRTLQELAFEADQDLDLAIASEATPVTDEIVADSVADLYAVAGARELALLQDMGWSPATLAKLTKLMTGPTAPVVEPSLGKGATAADGARAVVPAWLDAVDTTRRWFDSSESTDAKACLVADAAASSQTRRLDRVATKTFENNWKDLHEWLAAGAPAHAKKTSEKTWRGWIEDTWTEAALANKWKGPPDPDFAGAAVYRQITALCDKQAELWPTALAPFAATVRGRVERELARRSWLTYDGMLSGLAERLRGARGGALAEAIRDRYDVAIVDEFQDTDGAQWDILREAFHAAGCRFYAVGDPKQAIYSFRNANLAVYLDAAAACARFRLPRNFRSDGPLVGALNDLWAAQDEPFGDPRIAYEPVEANYGLRITGLPDVVTEAGPRLRRTLEIRLFDGSILHQDADEKVGKENAEAAVAELCAAECRALLESGAALGPNDDKRALRPKDIAVLVRKHRQGRAVKLALTRHGIPAVAGNQNSVFASEVVPWILAWLEAVANPGSEAAARQLARTPLAGWTAAELALALTEPTAGERADAVGTRRAWETLRQRVDTWARTFSKKGFFRVFGAFIDAGATFSKLLGSVHGERAAADLRHLAELCHVEERRVRPGPRGLADWLRSAAKAARDEDDQSDDLAQRLESDASAVQIVTVHASKGLQFPITMVPFEWGTDTPLSRHSKPVQFNRQMQPDGHNEVVVNLGLNGTEAREKALTMAHEERERENVRLLYVATTRALHHVVLWASATTAKHLGAVHRLLGLGGDGADDAAVLEALADASGGRTGWSREAAPVEPEGRWQPRSDQRDDDAVAAPLVASVWPKDRRLGASWMVASYSSLSAGKAIDVEESARRLVEIQGVDASSRDAEEATSDHSVVDHAADIDVTADIGALCADEALQQPAAGAALPGGKGTGNWLHGILERLDFAGAPGGRGKDGTSAQEVVHDQAMQHGISDAKLEGAVMRLLPTWLDTPLDVPLPPGGPAPLPAGFSLRQLQLSDRLDELRFDLRLGAGSRFRPSLRTGEGDYTGRIDPLAVRRALTAALDDPHFGGHAWLEALLDRGTDDPKKRDAAGGARLLPAIAGLLTGFVDLTFRVGGAGGRYFVCDYKSNVVRGPEKVQEWHQALPVPADPDAKPWWVRRLHYTRPLLTWAMGHAAYPLQALVYTVALHRHLGQRLGSAYHYHRNVGGHLYLFLRGMEGPHTLRPGGHVLGVYGDRWPARTVIGLDAALAGESPDEVQHRMDAHLRPGGSR